MGGNGKLPKERGRTMKRKMRRWLATAVAFAMAFSLTGTGVQASTQAELLIPEATEEPQVTSAPWVTSAPIEPVTPTQEVEEPYLSEDFENGQIPEGWTTNTNTEGYEWSVGVGIPDYDLGEHSGEGNAMIGYASFYAGQYAWLITPALDLSEVTGDVTLSFWYANPSYYHAFSELGIYYRVGEGEWQEICETTKYHNAWSKHVIILPEETKAEAIQFGFRAENFGSYGISLDDVVIQKAENEKWQVLTYAANYDGAEAALTKSCIEWSAVTVAENKFTAPEGTRFGGWNTQPDGSGENYKPGNVFVIKDDVTLYAQWLGNLTALDENFDQDGIPVGWKVIYDDEGKGWHIVRDGEETAFYEHVAVMDSFNANYDGSAWLISPMLDLRNGSGNYVLGLWYCNLEYNDKCFGLNICYRIDGGEWHELKKITDSHDSYTKLELILPEEARANNVEIGFQAVEAYSYGVGIDGMWLRNEQKYMVSISEEIVGGIVRSDMQIAEAGTTVTLTVMEKGINTFDKLIIKSGSEIIDYEQVDDETFTFVMPEGNVIIDALFIAPSNCVFYEGFDEEGALDGWTLVDADGDGYGWEIINLNRETDAKGNPLVLSEPNPLGSHSWFEFNVLYPDNWAITPAIKVPVNAVLSFGIKGSDPNYAAEIMAVYVGSSTNLDDMVKVGADYVGAPAYAKYEVDLSKYAGETIYIGFRHYNISDMFMLLLDDVSVYGEEILTDENLMITKKSLRLQDTIAIDFKVPASAVEGYQDPYLMVTQNDVTKKLTKYREENGLLIFTYRVAPQHMCDVVTAVPHARNAQGKDVTGEEFTYSVIEYCYNMLYKDEYQDDKYATFRRLLVDILRYGDAAQIYANYKTELLPTCDLTEGLLAMGTDVTKKMEYESVKEPLYGLVIAEDALASIEKAALYLEAAVNVRFKYSADDLSDLRVVITDNEACTHVIAQYEADASKIDQNGLYYVDVSCLNAGQMRKTIYATVMKGDKAVSNTYRYSIESYVASMKSKEIKNLNELLDAMMRYGDSAAAFANNN